MELICNDVDMSAPYWRKKSSSDNEAPRALRPKIFFFMFLYAGLKASTWFLGIEQPFNTSVSQEYYISV